MKQLLNHIIDEIATAEPDAPCFETPKSTKSYESGFHKVTRQRFASAIDGVAWWLDKSLGSGRDFQTLAYFGPWDARYNLLLFGAVKCGYKVRQFYGRSWMKENTNLESRWSSLLPTTAQAVRCGYSKTWNVRSYSRQRSRYQS